MHVQSAGELVAQQSCCCAGVVDAAELSGSDSASK